MPSQAATTKSERTSTHMSHRHHSGVSRSATSKSYNRHSARKQVNETLRTISKEMKHCALFSNEQEALERFFAGISADSYEDFARRMGLKDKDIWSESTMMIMKSELNKLIEELSNCPDPLLF
jgi:hypothetical protein